VIGVAPASCRQFLRLLAHRKTAGGTPALPKPARQHERFLETNALTP